MWKNTEKGQGINMSAKPSQKLLDLYDLYAHGLISRRTFFKRLSQYAVGGMTVAALAETLLPKYAEAQQISDGDGRIHGETIEYASPKGAGTMGGYLVRPSNAGEKRPGVVVIHENRGLNPYIADVARRVAIENYLVLAPDALYPLGGYPGNDDDGRTLQRQRDRNEMLEDFIAAVNYLQNHEDCTGSVGCVGFCFGGGIANSLAVRVPNLAAAVPFYGIGPATEDVSKINAPLLIHLGELDTRVNSGWPAYESALKAAQKTYTAYIYPGANHGFHNDTTPRYDEAAAKLAWQRTIEFFNQHLG